MLISVIINANKQLNLAKGYFQDKKEITNIEAAKKTINAITKI